MTSTTRPYLGGKRTTTSKLEDRKRRRLKTRNLHRDRGQDTQVLRPPDILRDPGIHPPRVIPPVDIQIRIPREGHPILPPSLTISRVSLVILPDPDILPAVDIQAPTPRGDHPTRPPSLSRVVVILPGLDIRPVVDIQTLTPQGDHPIRPPSLSRISLVILQVLVTPRETAPRPAIRHSLDIHRVLPLRIHRKVSLGDRRVIHRNPETHLEAHPVILPGLVIQPTRLRSRRVHPGLDPLVIHQDLDILRPPPVIQHREAALVIQATRRRALMDPPATPDIPVRRTMRTA